MPEAVQARLQYLLDRQDAGKPLTAEERDEAAGLVELAEFLSLLKMNRPTILAIRAEEIFFDRPPPPLTA